jgi:hypothetical protein
VNTNQPISGAQAAALLLTLVPPLAVAARAIEVVPVVGGAL